MIIIITTTIKSKIISFLSAWLKGPYLLSFSIGLDINERDGVSIFSGVSTVLQRFEACSQSLQKIESDLDTVAKTCIAEFRERFDDFDLQASELC